MSKKSSTDSSKVWGIFSLVAALAAAAAARKALNASWKAATGKPPPANPASPDVSMREAVAWAAVSGTIVAVARMLATRRAAQYYARSTGHLPPGVTDDA
jgi:subtilisin family serine protease